MIEFPGVENETQQLEQFLEESQSLPASDELSALQDEARQHIGRLSTAIGIAFAGEFSAGKSSLANMLAGADILPTGIRHLQLPLVILNYSDKPRTVAGWWGQEHKTFPGIALTDAAEINPDFISIGLDTPALQQVSLFDLPGTGASGIAHDDTNTLDLLKFVDCAIWCTNGTSPWRESERQIWKQVPDNLKKSSLLAVTHTDLPAVKDELPEILKRLDAEKGDLFQEVIPIATPDAVSALADGPEPDFDRWNESGGQLLAEQILTVASRRREIDLENARRDLKEKFLPLLPGVADDAVVEEAEEEVKTPASATASENEMLATWKERLSDVLQQSEAGEIADSTELLQSCQEIVEEFAERLIDTPLPASGAEWVPEEFERATDLLLLLQFETGDGPVNDALNVMHQLGDTLSWAGSQA